MSKSNFAAPASPAQCVSTILYSGFSMSGICFPNSLGYLLRMTMKMTILYKMQFQVPYPESFRAGHYILKII
jgi:hypothetical protein